MSDNRPTKPPQPPLVTEAAEAMRIRRTRTEKLAIGSLDDEKLTVSAQYNPKEIQLEKQIPWQPHNERNNKSDANRPRNGEQDDAELNSAPTRSMSLELLFDGYEDHRSIQPELDDLETLSSIMASDSTPEHNRRPHHCVVAWGAAGMKPFRCVIESLSTSLTMFDDNGAPVRATCKLKLKEVLVLSRMSADVDDDKLRTLLKDRLRREGR